MKRNVIINGKINNKFIPRISNDETQYKLMLVFDFS